MNFTASNSGVASAFRSIGDYNRPGHIEDIAYLLERGVKVTLGYGDRDFACNWIGGEALSLAVDYEDSEQFRSAGYANIVVNETFNVGLVRQHGNFSYLRVYQAGHEIPSYQPEGAMYWFYRALFNRDIATGGVDTAVNPDYSSEGPSDTLDIRNEVPEPPKPTCYVLNLESCTQDQIYEIGNGTAEIRNFIFIDENTSGLFDNSTSENNSTGTPSPTPTAGGESPTAGGETPPATSTGAAAAIGANAVLVDGAMGYAVNAITIAAIAIGLLALQ